MKFTYTPNPLNIIVELTDHEREILWYKVKVEELEESLSSAYFHLRDGKYFNLETARKDLDLEYFLNEDENGISGIDKRVNMLVNDYYIPELRCEHAGDCTCFPCSCTKCHVESLLGIDTTPGLGKHMARKIRGAFVYKDCDTWKERTMDEALELLNNYNPKADWEGWEAYAPRWKEEAKTAYEWLVNYNETFIKGN